MEIFSKPAAIIKIQLLLGSQARNYFETKERLFLQTILSKLQNSASNDLGLINEEKNMLEIILAKYDKYIRN